MSTTVAPGLLYLGSGFVDVSQVEAVMPPATLNAPDGGFLYTTEKLLSSPFAQSGPMLRIYLSQICGPLLKSSDVCLYNTSCKSTQKGRSVLLNGHQEQLLRSTRLA